ncbi:MAG: hypothetical protein ABI488_03510 [Polyangiaceae bacterium]
MTTWTYETRIAELNSGEKLDCSGLTKAPLFRAGSQKNAALGPVSPLDASLTAAVR